MAATDQILNQTLLRLDPPLGRPEAPAIVNALCEKIYHRWKEKVSKGRFMQEPMEGRLSMEALRLFCNNWYSFVSEVNNFHGIAFQRFLGWLKLHADLHAAHAAKVSDELMHPKPPGHL